ncbi:LCP family protein [Paractinoplanes durhamensis]|uniref:Transcriptional regulator n=1 Tax=Paractinoplanes durhamensis TaxID=113563 RepID=A0ABQ3Z3D5_9ACTN|nr:LCP family protein [Actinoplanes durhamensis]GIE04315.1 transcriptional regulator [Actinoplanes durhamensis]
MPTRQPIYDRDATEVIGPANDPNAPGVAPGKHKNKKRNKKKIILICVLVPLVLVGLGLLGGGIYLHNVESNVQRVDAFESVPEASRPQKDAVAKDAINFLLLGSDTRDPENVGGSRSDTIIVLHLNKDQNAAQLISIPRDTWVHIPKSANGKHGNVDSKINAAYAWGGVPLMVQTVEDYTDVRIDHVALVDFAGFKEIVDALGGVTVDVETTFTSTHSLNANSIRHFDKGVQQMDGAAALDYARERYSFKDGDFARIRHQQQVIKAILDKASSGGVLSSPTRINAFLKATTDTVSVDKDLNMLSMATQLRHLRSGNLNFYTSPTKGTGKIGDQSVVLPDTAKAKALFDAVRKDDTATIEKLGAESAK